MEETDYLSSFQMEFTAGHKRKMALVTLVDYPHWDLDGSTAFVLVPLGFFTPFGPIIHGIQLDCLQELVIVGMGYGSFSPP